MTPSPLSPMDDPTIERFVERIAARMSSHGSGRRRDEWARWIVGAMLAGLIAYLTTIGTIDKQVGQIDERENNHFAEVLRRLDVMQADVRDLRETR